MDDGFEMHLLGGDQREALLQVEAHLITEDRDRAGAGSVVLAYAVREHMVQQVVILTHGPYVSWYNWR